MSDPRDRLPRAVQVLEAGMEEGLHIGAQLYVEHKGKTVVDCGMGESREGVPMDENSMMIWWSATKPTASVSIAQLWERGKLDIEAPVAEYIPEFAANSKESVTLRHCLTHTAGFRFAGRKSQGKSWDEQIAELCNAWIEEGWVPGKKAGYHPGSSWMILGEVVRRVDGRPFEQYVRDEIFQPLDMNDCWVGMPPERYREYGDRIGVMHNTSEGPAKPVTGIDTERGCARCSPGGGGRGPMRELARLYEALLNNGQRGEARILSPQTVQAITARHRTGMFDETFQTHVDWGLGFNIDGILYGRHSSSRTFGHGGAQSSVGFADPEHDLVVACVTNGMAEARLHYQRFSRTASAIYLDLGLAEEGDPGRERLRPKTGLA